MSDVEKNIGTHKPEFDGEWVRLKGRIEYVRGVAYKPESDLRQNLNDDSYVLLRANNIKNGEIDLVDVQYVSRAKVKPSQLLRKGDILVCASSGSRSLVGKAALIKEDMSATFGAFCCVIRSLEGESSYLGHYFQSDAYRRKIEQACSGSNINNLKADCFFDLRVPVRKVETRGLIVRQLDALRTQIKMSQKQLSALDDLVKSQFVEMFGDTYSNSKQLPSRKLGALIDFITSGSRGWSKYYSNEGDYFITIKNVRGCSISLDNVQHVHAPNNKEAERTKVQSGDVLISITANLGRTGVVSTEIADHGAYINQHLACIRLAGEDILPLYLSFFLESPGAKDQLQRKNQTGVKAGLNFDLVKSLDILVPPLALQQQFADFVARADKLGFDCCRETVCCGVLFSSMSASLLCT